MNKLDKSAHNWLAHKINNDSFSRLSKYIKGCVVDLGCGNAPYKEDILKIADKYVGVDWSNTFFDIQNVDLFADFSGPLPLLNESVDTVTAFQVMEHLKEPGLFLSECNRILHAGGHLILTVPFMWHVHDEPYDYFRYTRYGLEYLLRKSDFSDIEITEGTGFWQMFILKINYHTQRYFRGPLKYMMIPFWWMGQVISPLMDKVLSHPQETAGYSVVARKS
jgi:SAM-dependent methyltransferase